MNNRRVDQKLYFARLALDAADTDATAAPALIEAALFHLDTAYRSYLREILAPLALPLASTKTFNPAKTLKQTLMFDSAQQAAEYLRALNICDSALDELIELEQSDAWLARLRAAFVAASTEIEAEQPVATAAIALADITQQIDSATCRDWLRAFSELLQRQRNHAQEW